MLFLKNKADFIALSTGFLLMSSGGKKKHQAFKGFVSLKKLSALVVKKIGLIYQP